MRDEAGVAISDRLVTISSRVVRAAKERLYFVFLDRNYATPETRPKYGPLASAHVRATRRTEAAMRVWEKYKEQWLPLVTTGSKRVSLHVGMKGSVTGKAERLSPIRVQ